MSQILKIDENIVFIGNEDGTMLEVSIGDLNYPNPQVGDLVQVFKGEDSVIVSKKGSAPASKAAPQAFDKVATSTVPGSMETAPSVDPSLNTIKMPAKKKPIFKQWWFYTIIAVVVIAIIIVIAVVSSGGNGEIRKAKGMSKNDFIESCEKYDYMDLSANPDKYKGKHIKVDVRVAQVLDDNDLRAYGGNDAEPPANWYDDEYYMTNQSDSDKKPAEDNVVTVYGVYQGEETIKRSLGGTDNLPSVAVLYTAESETQAKIQAIKDDIKFKKVSNEYGWKTYKAVVKNPLDIDFDSLHISLSLEKKGTVVSNEEVYVENWKSGEKTTFEFLTDKSFDKIVVKKLQYYKF